MYLHVLIGKQDNKHWNLHVLAPLNILKYYPKPSTTNLSQLGGHIIFVKIYTKPPVFLNCVPRLVLLKNAFHLLKTAVCRR